MEIETLVLEKGFYNKPEDRLLFTSVCSARGNMDGHVEGHLRVRAGDYTTSEKA